MSKSNSEGRNVREPQVREVDISNLNHRELTEIELDPVSGGAFPFVRAQMALTSGGSANNAIEVVDWGFGTSSPVSV
jgi:hypothetical protein